MKTLFSLLFVLAIAIQAHAQSTLDKVPPSPTAASIIGVSEISTSKYTGTPNISIPIYQVGYHNMSVPISLSYNAQGLKVNDVPGWVGANWALNAGGVITRMINGLPDDKVSSGYFTVHPGYENSGLTTVAQLKEYDKGDRDGNPDVYSFSFPGGSGKFIIDHSKEFHVFPHQKMDIDFVDQTSKNLSQGFTITTLDGTIYTFTETETTQIPASGNLSGGTYTTAWYLSSIKHPTFPNKEITFDYTGYMNLEDVRKIKTYTATREYYNGGYYNNISSSTVTTERNVDYNVKRLEKISWGIGSVEFIAEDERVDVDGDSTLNIIRINDHQDNVLKEFRLTYNYYATGSKKLRLDKVQEFEGSGVNDDSKPAYEFTYDTGAIPDYNVTGQDFWGYYNGKDSNTDLLPKQTVDFLRNTTSESDSS